MMMRLTLLLACLYWNRGLAFTSSIIRPKIAPFTSLRIPISSSSSTSRLFSSSDAPPGSATKANDGAVTQQQEVNEDYSDDDVEHADAVVCGGGPVGLLTAIMLAQRFPSQKIRVFDRLSAPPSPDDDTVWSDVAKFYLLGMGGRGQNPLKRFGVWKEVEERCVAVLGRKDWAPDSEEGVERIFNKKDKPVTTQVLPRDKLVGVLHEHILNNYNGRIELNYGYEIHPVDFEYSNGAQVLVNVAKCSDEIARLNPTSVVNTATEEKVDTLCDVDNAALVATDLLVAADGTVRTVANAIEAADKERFAAMNPVARLFAGKPFKVKRYVDDNQRIYKTIPMKIPPDWRGDLNYSARTKNGRINYDALPANTNGEYCGVLLLKKGDEMAQSDTDPVELRKLLDESLPQFSTLLDDETVAKVAKKPVSYLPGFRYAGPRLRQGNRCVLVGDCSHTVKPYFGLGASAGLEDVQILDKCMDENNNDLTKAVHEYSHRQAGEAKALVHISRQLDRPGKLGFITFIFPLILDSIFSGLFPKFFTPNVISMLQRENYTFRQVARRKRLDRTVQLSLIASALTGSALAAKFVVHSLAKVSGRSRLTVFGGMTATFFCVSYLKKFLAKFFVNGMAPADVMARLARKVGKRNLQVEGDEEDEDGDVGNGESFLTPLGFKNKKASSQKLGEV